MTGPGAAAPGSNLTYNISVTNNGPDSAASITWSDTLPPNTTFVSVTQTAGSGYFCSSPAVGSAGTISCAFTVSAEAPRAHAAMARPNGAGGVPGGSGADGFSLVVKLSPSAAPGSTISNTATVTTSSTDPAAGNNSATVVTLVPSATVPALSTAGFALLALLLGLLGLRTLRPNAVPFG